MAEELGESRNQIQRFIRLTNLVPELLDMVDEKKIAFNPAYELSFLKKRTGGPAGRDGQRTGYPLLFLKPSGSKNTVRMGI